MGGSKLFLIFWTLFLLRSGVISHDKIPATDENLGSMLGSSLESKQILAQLLDLKSLVLALSGSVGAMDTRIKNMESLITETDVKASKRADAIEAKLEELGRNTNSRDGSKNENRERMSSSKSGSGKRVKLNCKINTTRSIIPNLEEHMAVAQRHLLVLLNKTREERRQRADDHQELVSTLVKIHPSRVLTGVERTAKIESMINNPTVTFFKWEDMTGEAVYYQENVGTYNGGCKNLREIKSMRTSNSCVRVFREQKCEGKSRALYPKPDSGLFINFLTSEIPSIGSVGPCLPNEFDFSTVTIHGHKISITKDPFNVRQVPDFVDFSSHNTYRHRSCSGASTSILKYCMDQGRLAFVYADIKRHHLYENTGATSGRNLVIPPGLGGPRHEAYNTFLQTQNNFEEWKQITDRLQTAIKGNGWAYVHITFTYENASVAQPYGFYYQIFKNLGGNDKILYGFIPN